MPVEMQTLSEEQASKDQFFERLGEIADQMAAAHGKDFAMGALVLAARWLAENKAATPRPSLKPQ